MNRILKIVLIALGSLLGLIILIIVISALWISISANHNYKKSIALAGPEVKTITVQGISFRDLNKNGKLDIYEDSRAPVKERVSDLLSQMDLSEKAGTMFIPPVNMSADGSIAEKPAMGDWMSFLSRGTSLMLFEKKINHFNIFTVPGKRQMAIWYNNLQELAGRTRLGIPITIASDPRNHFSSNPLTSAFSGDFTAFPEPIGLAAIGDSLLTAQFADIARQEYIAAGIRVALHPMADLATEPRWGRINGTFGEDAALSAKLTYAYVRGFQGDSIGPESVACMTKHFSGGGPQKEGIDPHFYIAKGQVYPGNNFDYHLIPFEAAFKAGTAEIMPYYGVPMDKTSENVGFAFNKEMITGLLRNHYHFDGVVCTDWGIISDMKVFGMMVLPARARGMEKATEEERMFKVIDAGCDQFGGELLPEMLIKLVNNGKISEARLDTSVRRLLRVKFQMGLFDNPFIDPDYAEKIIGNPEFRAVGDLAQRRSIVLLKNDSTEAGALLPLGKGLKVYCENIDTVKVGKYAKVVSKPEEADIAIIRIKTPSQHLEGTGVMGYLIQGGDIDFKEEKKAEILALLNKVPTVVDIYMDRPAVFPEIVKTSKGLLANFGAENEALLDVIFGKFNPEGKLPFELPSSMEAVRNQKEDLPYDSADPLFPFGFGLHY